MKLSYEVAETLLRKNIGGQAIFDGEHCIIGYRPKDGRDYGQAIFGGRPGQEEVKEYVLVVGGSPINSRHVTLTEENIHLLKI